VANAEKKARRDTTMHHLSMIDADLQVLHPRHVHSPRNSLTMLCSAPPHLFCVPLFRTVSSPAAAGRLPIPSVASSRGGARRRHHLTERGRCGARRRAVVLADAHVDRRQRTHSIKAFRICSTRASGRLAPMADRARISDAALLSR